MSAKFYFSKLFKQRRQQGKNTTSLRQRKSIQNLVIRLLILNCKPTCYRLYWWTVFYSVATKPLTYTFTLLHLVLLPNALWLLFLPSLQYVTSWRFCLETFARERLCQRYWDQCTLSCFLKLNTSFNSSEKSSEVKN